MDKKIPVYFDTIILDTPIQEISNEDSNDCRLQVAVFTKYRNRNGSYITDEYAEHLIASATRGNCPVVGFFDPETQSWASHTGPTLANGYGYVESFLGWQPFTDTDGVTRDYAVFSVILFTEYYEEAKKIRGQHQSMELDEKTITGDWANFDGEEFFVYKTGDMLGLCVIGAHEPCFSVSSFFSKNDDTYKSQYEKFSSLLSNLKALVEEAENNIKGGEQPMDEFEKKEEEVVNPTPVEEEETPAEFEAEENKEEEIATEEVAEFSAEEEPAAEPEEEKEEEPSEFDLLQQRFNDLQNSSEELQKSFDELQAKFAEATNNIEGLNANIKELQEQNSELQSTIVNYQAAEAEREEARKNSLIEKYEKVLSEEEINPIKDMVKDFSYETLEGKLAITYANKQIAGSEETKKVPLPEPEDNSFANFMKKYKK